VRYSLKLIVFSQSYFCSGLCLYFHIEEKWIYSRQNLLAISIGIFYVAVGVFVTGLTLVQSLMADISPKGGGSSSKC
jgi:hypothetical protein